MYPNPLKRKLQNGELVLGTALPVPHPLIAGAILDTRPDFLWIDTEHGPFGVESLGAIPALARMRGVAPMIRVAGNDPALIKKAYDVGAVAVMVPQVNTPDEARQAIEYARYPPIGQRGISPSWPRITGDDWNEVIKTANEETVLILQMESRQAYDNIEAIAAVPGYDVMLVGPMDLSASVGRPTELGSKEVLDIVRDVPKRLEGTGIVAGTTLGDLEEVRDRIRWGYRFLNVGNALGYGVQVAGRNLETLRSEFSG
jgi:4-hydroxy-2-oxoheptanedioate aldolase